jgi:signal transduction histidine kinase
VLRAAAAGAAAFSLAFEIEEGTKRMSAIVGALKSYSYLDQAPVQEIDLHRGLDDTLLIMRSKLEGITVERDYAADLPRVTAYAGELNQVWTNLIDNAADALAEAGGGTLTVHTRRDGDMVVVEIEDDGPGIPPEVKPRIFDAFFTTKPPGSGTGLGLDITYGIVVHKHRGSIDFESHPGRTVFRVELPIEQPA